MAATRHSTVNTEASSASELQANNEDKDERSEGQSSSNLNVSLTARTGTNQYFLCGKV